MNIAQPIAAAVGVGILACVTNAAIYNTGGYATTTAPMLIALASGLAIGAAVIGIAWRHQRRTLAVLLVIALGAGEAFALLTTAERTLAIRDGQQAPLRDAAQQRTKAEEAVAMAESDLEEVGHMPRLQRALEAKAKADSAAVEKAAEPGCARNCRVLLEQQVAAAAAEVDAARVEIAENRQAAERRLSDARAALAEIALPPSPSPLADRLGVEAWKIDLVAAGLASIAANGLAALLIAFAAHQQGTPPTPARVPTDVNMPSSAIPLIASVPPAAEAAITLEPPRVAEDEAAQFARTMFRPAKRGRVRVRDMRVAYESWCANLQREPLPDVAIVRALMALFTRAGLRCDLARGDAEIVGMTWIGSRPALIGTAPALRIANTKASSFDAAVGKPS